VWRRSRFFYLDRGLLELIGVCPSPVNARRSVSIIGPDGTRRGIGLLFDHESLIRMARDEGFEARRTTALGFSRAFNAGSPPALLFLLQTSF
jgi:hypothetical protein